MQVTYYVCEGGGGGGGGRPDPLEGGGGGGGNPSNPQGKDPVAPKAEKLFKGDLTEDEWKALEKLIEEIINDCMGTNLYASLVDLLKSNGISIEIDPNLGGNSQYNSATKTITLSSLNHRSLFHELFHSYQFISDNYSTSRGVNAEIEVRLAQYVYGSRRGLITPGSYADKFYNYDDDGKAIVRASLMLNNKGDIMGNKTEFYDLINMAGYGLMGYPEYTLQGFTLDDPTTIDNYKFLAKDC